MTMIGEPMLLNPKIRIPRCNPLDDPAAAFAASYFANAGTADSPTAIRRYEIGTLEFDSFCEEDLSMAVDAFSCDHFRMFEFKIRTCARGRSHDWTKCPYAHPGEKARRRDPRKFQYSGVECPDLRQGSCMKGESCEFAHGVFESWLHPDRYRTQPCRDGMACLRRVCFFAHSSEELRISPSPNPNSNPNPRSPRAKGSPISSPTSILFSPSISPPSDSPPMSPNSPVIGCESVFSLMQNLQLSDMKEIAQRAAQIRSGFGSPRVSNLRPAINIPSTPARSSALDLWDKNYEEEEPPMERVESGRDLRALMYAKLMKENSL